ncbi:MAG: electron transfer flavoprotein subunit alpha/FixB family protein [Candidatus Nanopelagicales bacterium]|jgi:electron transfer flavoprotein alpha subunit|nr:electron transfer flavoprotein subunit alpha/FixB family protein [Actinomycetota bacterium]NCG02620.1 electron transfer flavoprotein subunit alpha/FixB family protein [Actinomycetales bacterium]MBT5182176.1 electron transfer flavoprotein subunit alpha/FixB family protein [Actinomycetota bacterium]MBT5501549.1 electron transfer flavoprotein subunit alpha/FixB family protein [Actinomycetota bacterium]MBT5805912.1 electron transfer flavoprotein subunit alpha/FixB family protein [Actinomycetota 
MADVLVLAEHHESEIRKVTFELITAARGLGSPVVLWLGSGLGDITSAALASFGATKILLADSADVIDHPVAPGAEIVASLIESLQPAAVLVASSADGKEIAARAAIKSGCGIITDAVEIATDGTATQSVFGGSTIVHSKVTHGTPIITIRPNSIAASESAATAVTEKISMGISDSAKRVSVTTRSVVEKGARPELAEADVVVSGGRGVGGAEGFEVIEALADSLSAAVGASRAATDAGWYPHQFQVGQTGKTVSPALYIASGISGAIQHRAGMQTSKVVIVVNKDPEAPIFELADYGVVGDLFTVVPQLTEEITQRK